MEASVRILGRTATRRILSSNAHNTTRAFSTTPLRLQENDFPSTTPSSRSTVTRNLSNFLDESLDLKKGPSSTRQSRGSSRSSSSPYNKIDAITSELTAPHPRKSSPSSPSSPSTRFDYGPDTYLGSSSISGPPSGISHQNELPQVKLDPTIGRTVTVDLNRSMDVGKAFRTLNMQCFRNRVRQDFNRQRFHERPGLKRKRLKGERWRRNFKKGFKEVVAMVERMKRQGW